MESEIDRDSQIDWDNEPCTCAICGAGPFPEKEIYEIGWVPYFFVETDTGWVERPYACNSCTKRYLEIDPETTEWQMKK